MNNANFIAFDFETATTDRMPCQIGITIVRDGVIVETLEYLIRPPYNEYSRRCIDVHGITPDKTENAREFPDVWSEIGHFFDAAFVVAHNIDFDLDVLYSVLHFYGLTRPIFMGVKCTYRDVTDTNLAESCRRLGIPLKNAHSAGADSQACARIFLKYLSGEIEGTTPPMEEVQSAIFREEEWRHEHNITGDLLELDLSQADPSNPFYLKKVVISGSFSRWPDRRDLARFLKNNGAKVNSSVSGRTDFLVVGAAPGWKKIKTAQENEIKIIGEEELISILTEANIWNTPTM